MNEIPKNEKQFTIELERKDIGTWKKPLIRVLEGHSDLLRITSEFPKLGKLPSLGEPPIIVVPGEGPLPDELGPKAASAIVTVVVVVVVVAVAARPGAIPNEEILRAKLLDVYSPNERMVLSKAISMVNKNPSLIKYAIGIEHSELGKNFMSRLNQVQTALK